MEKITVRSSPKKPPILPKLKYTLKDCDASMLCKMEPSSPQKLLQGTGVTTSPLQDLRNRRPLDISKLKCPLQKTHTGSNSRRNTRERNRMKVINTTFVTLQKHLPTHFFNQKKSNKVSKVDILRSAISYIHTLQDVLDTTGSPCSYNTQLSQVPGADYSAQAAALGLSSVSAGFTPYTHLADCITPAGLASLVEGFGVPDSPAYQVFSPTDSTGHAPSPLSSDSASQAPSTPDYADWVQ